MNLQRQITVVLLGLLMALPTVPAWAQQNVRVVGTVRDETNAIALPGTPVEVVGTSQVVYTDVDGRYVLTVPPGTHQIKVVLDGYQDKLVSVTTGEERTMTVDIGIVMSRFAETVNCFGSVCRCRNVVRGCAARRAAQCRRHYRQPRSAGNARERRFGRCRG